MRKFPKKLFLAALLLVLLFLIFFPKDCNIACCERGFCKCYGIPISVGEKQEYEVKCLGYKYHPCCDECGGFLPLDEMDCPSYVHTYCDKDTGEWKCDRDYVPY